MQVPENELKGFILDSGLVSRKDVLAAEETATRTGRSVGDVLVSEGLLSPDSLRRIVSYVLGVPFVDLKGRRLDFSVLSLIPEPVARTRGVVAYAKDGDTLEVALLDTRDLAALEPLSLQGRVRLLPRLTDEGSLKHALLSYQKSLKDEFGDLIRAEASRINLIEGADASGMKRMAEDLPIVRIVDTLLKHAIVQKASDIHIEPLEEETLVRYRIGGVLHDAMALPAAALPGMLARVKVLAGLRLDERGPQDGRFALATEAERVSFRVSFLPTYAGERAVLRLLRETGEGFTLDVLGFHGEGLERVHEALRRTGGLILVAGPAGSGKTTTLYTMLDILNRPELALATIEDPVEYQMKRVHQVQADAASGFTMAAGLRAVLRQDPDIVMVGEVRDAETAAMAVNAALSGRLVLAAVAAPSAAEGIARFLGMGVDPFLLASTLRLAIGQRLVRRLADGKEEYALGNDARDAVAPEAAFQAALRALAEEKLVKAGTRVENLPFYRPASSADGYQGSIGLFEALPVSESIRTLILNEAAPDRVEERARKEGMLAIEEDGIYKAARGITSLEEVERALHS